MSAASTDVPVSVIIPAHNEAATLARTLSALHDGAAEHLEVLVVCNGCTDITADIARAATPPVRVIEIEQPSKAEAVRVGNAATGVFPRVHLDADVELTGASLRALVAPLLTGDALAAAPRREVPRRGCAPLVRWYYDVWEQLPQVRAGLFGRGVIALSSEGQARVSALPRVMSDDLAVSEAFTAAERRVVEDAVVIVHPPRTMRDLLRRRVRVVTGNKQADDAGTRGGGSATSLSTLLTLARQQPRLLPRLPVFLGVTVLGRLLARRAIRTGDFTTWQRDESSRIA